MSRFRFGLVGNIFDKVGGQWGLFGGPDAAAGYGIWAWKVRQGGDWDHKPKLQTMFDREGEYFYNRVPGTDKAISYDLWSNIHYGYVGIDVGIPDTDLQAFGNDPPDPVR